MATPLRQRSTEQRSTVDSRRRLKNFKMLVSHAVSAVLRHSVQLLIKSSRQSILRNMSTVKFVEDAVKISNIFEFSTLTR